MMLLFINEVFRQTVSFRNQCNKENLCIGYSVTAQWTPEGLLQHGEEIF